MLKVLQLIFAPNETWERIVAAKHGALRILLVYCLPLILLGVVLQGLGLIKIGTLPTEFASPRPQPVAPEVVWRFAALRFGFDLVLLLLTTQVVYWLAASFIRGTTFSAAFRALAYSLGPLFLSQGLEGIPYLNAWLCWGLGILFTLHLLYHGIALALQPNQSTGFGLFLSGALVVLLLSGLTHFVFLAAFRRRLLI